MNAAAAKLWLAIVADDGPEETDPPFLELSKGSQGGLSISAFRTECRHVLSRLGPELVVLLDPEPTGTLTWKTVFPRAAAEVLLAAEATEAGVACERVSRAAVRGAHHLGRSGKLTAHVGTIFPEPVGTYWVGKRDLAALAAAARHGAS